MKKAYLIIVLLLFQIVFFCACTKEDNNVVEVHDSNVYQLTEDMLGAASKSFIIALTFQRTEEVAYYKKYGTELPEDQCKISSSDIEMNTIRLEKGTKFKILKKAKNIFSDLFQIRVLKLGVNCWIWTNDKGYEEEML